MNSRTAAPPVPSKVVTQLRRLVAGEIANAKAYDVPALCRRLGLGDGQEAEAYDSKAKYAQRRLADVSAAEVMAIAKSLLEEADNFDLSETVCKIEELGSAEVTELSRRRLLALFDTTPLATTVDEIDLIRKVWPIRAMSPVYEPTWGQTATLEDNIIQHTVRNFDWSGKELLEHLGLLTCSRTLLFKFLEAVVDPMMRNPDEQIALAASLNAVLAHDGYSLEVVRRVSGSPLYGVRSIVVGAPSDIGISAALVAFDPTDVHSRWEEALHSRQVNPQRAITLSRTLLEDVCKWVLTQAAEPFDDGADLPLLYRRMAKVLNLAPDDHTEQVFKQILSGCNSVVTGLGTLRNKLGDAHSIGPVRARPLPRHAELAVNLAGAMATFLVATWEAKRSAASGERQVSQGSNP